MLALDVRLEFSCCVCGHDIGVTLRCEGQGLAANPLSVVPIPCPTCGGSNLLHFTPEDGRLHRVTRERQYCRIPELSHN
jgi:hypothetical protein